MAKTRLDDSVVESYLNGNRFDESVSFDYDFERPVQDRVEILLRLATNRRMLHIGCCDHLPILAKKMAAGSWLHGRISDVAAYCVGIDIDAQAVARARELSRLTNIFCGNIATADRKIEQITMEKFDYAVFGEVIEHIGDPVAFLASFLKNYQTNIDKVVITVPNALSARNVRNIFKSRETINSDHRFFFTPYTLCKVAWDAGLRPVSLQVARYSAPGLLKQAILNRLPLLADDLVYIGVPR